MFKVIKVKYTNEEEIKEGYQIINEPNTYYRVNEFLRRQSIRGSINTCKQYAYKLCKFLNFLQAVKNKTYLEATSKDVDDFLNYLMYRIDEGIFYIKEGKVTYNSLSMYVTVIKGFYVYLNKTGFNYRIDVKYRQQRSQFSEIHGKIHDIEIDDFLNNLVERTKPTKDYIKWYEEDQVQSILSNLNTLRDKAIFLLSLEGMRIDEIISLRIHDYNQNKRFVELYKSKGRETGNVNRTVALPTYVCKILDDYIYNERSLVIKHSIKELKTVSSDLFLNLKLGEHLGQKVKYRNIIQIIKTAAKNSGLNKDMIRTHSGRSTKVMELLYYQAEHPESKITDEIIRQMMGWESPSSIKPYINARDLRISRLVAKKIQDNKGDFIEEK